ncbi:MAG: GEVED domain-containing protein, partial [Pirellulaceae bacterium]|nr:GEVED domain-containing protein [Pirellulaceae bacterium]
SETTVIGYTLYQDNVTDVSNANLGLGAFAIVGDPGDPLFVDADSGNYYLAAGSAAIDSALDALQDRPEMVRVREPLGIALSPIKAPELDAHGQKRVDDPSVDTPAGQGANVFVDRGAIGRVDFAGPTSVLIHPRDNDAAGLDEDDSESFVQISASLNRFSVHLIDGVEPNDPQFGSGIDDASVTNAGVQVLRNSERLEEGVDYDFSYDATNDTLHLVPLTGIWDRNSTYEISLVNRDGTLITALSGEQVNDGANFDVTDLLGNTANFEFNSGYSLEVPQTFTLELPLAGVSPSGITDGQTFSVVRTDESIKTFEFDLDGVLGELSSAIPVVNGQTASELGDQLVTILEESGLGLAPIHLGLGVVQIGSLEGQDVDVSGSQLTLSGQAAGVEDGDLFTIDDFTQVVSFEFDDDGVVAADADFIIEFQRTQTHEQIATEVVAAIAAANVSLNPVHYGEGHVHLGGDLVHTIDASLSHLNLLGQPGVRSGFGIALPHVAGSSEDLIADGDSFTLSNSFLTETFEFDDDNVGTPGNRIISLTDQTTDQLASAIAAAVNLTNLNLLPLNVGGGRIMFANSDATHVLDVTNSTLTQLGAAGVPGATAIEFIPDETWDATMMATAIAAAINSNVEIEAVDAFARVDQVLVQGVSQITDGSQPAVAETPTTPEIPAQPAAILVDDVPAIRDIAGNALKPNRITGESRFTIFIGSGLDFGDAPAGYPVLEEDDGARHTILAGFGLGNDTDTDSDGIPSELSDGDDILGFDDEDGVTVIEPLTAVFGGKLNVFARGISAESPGAFLDAWIDFDRDGVWSEAEHVIRSVTSDPVSAPINGALAGGDNEFVIDVPGSVDAGFVNARFRMSLEGGLQPTGPAGSGEVEDYQLPIYPNPWTNPAGRLDVNGDGFYSSIDALLLLNRINLASTSVQLGPLPDETEVPPYLDVDSDGSLTFLDVILVIDNLNLNGPGNVEGESAASLQVEPPTPAETRDLLLPLSADATLVSGALSTATSPASQVNVATAVDVEFEVPARPATATERQASPLERFAGDESFEDLLASFAEDVQAAHDSEDPLEDVFARF